MEGTTIESAARMRTRKHDVLRQVWKGVAVPSIMYGNVTAWSEKKIDKLEVGQHRVARMALNAQTYATVEALRGNMGCSTFRETHEGGFEIQSKAVRVTNEGYKKSTKGLFVKCEEHQVERRSVHEDGRQKWRTG